MLWIELGRAGLSAVSSIISVYDSTDYSSENPGFRTGTSYQMEYVINSNGLRESEFQIKKPKDQFRILVLGDSVIFGQGVRQSETLVERLEKSLMQSSIFDSVQVINGGVVGYGPHQERGFLEREGVTYDPDIVILGFCHNDLTDAARWAPAPKRVQGSDVLKGRREMRRWSALYHLFRGTFQRLVRPPEEVVVARLPPPVDHSLWDYTIPELRALGHFLETVEVPFVLIAIPVRDEIERGARRDTSGLEQLAREEPVFLLDLYAAFAQHRHESLFLDPVHLSSRGNGVAARALHDYLLSNALLERHQ